MATSMTLAQVEALAAQLSPQDQLKLVAHICEHLISAGPSPKSSAELFEEAACQQRLAEADALLTKLDAVAESIEGEFDAAEDIRQIRKQRADRL